MIPRLLKLPFHKRSVFLFGPRQVGKSTLVKYLLSDTDHLLIDLLKNDVLTKYKSAPDLLRSEIEFLLKSKEQVIVIIDEIQKCAELLNEIHWLIEQFPTRVFFIMTGSSARKLKRASVNMLAGRAWRFFLLPFTHLELEEVFNLDTVLLRGSLPTVVNESMKDAFRTLKSYVEIYLKEEILDEALVRNFGAFSRFLEIAADHSGSIVNYSTISRDTGVNSKTIKGYYEILQDTLIALKLDPFLKSARKRLVMHPKYYLFDTGVVNAICGRIELSNVKGSSTYGMLFEHFIILETFRLINYAEKAMKLYHWRASSGAEVDLIVEAADCLWAVEIKSSPNVKQSDLKGLKSFMSDHPQAVPICVSTCEMPYMAGQFQVIPWHMLFQKDYLSVCKENSES